jgi:hypothetical protein
VTLPARRGMWQTIQLLSGLFSSRAGKGKLQDSIAASGGGVSPLMPLWRLRGHPSRYYIWVGKHAFDGAVCPRLAESRKMDEVLWFLGECWKDLGRPEQAQFGNARELSGWGQSARALSRVIRLWLRFEVSPVFIPDWEPQLGGSAENFNGWFQPRLFDHRFRRPGDLRRELARLQEAVNTHDVHPRPIAAASGVRAANVRSTVPTVRHHRDGA